jgi:hypothetical protein
MTRATRIALERWAPSFPCSDATPLYCLHCASFVAWTVVPKTQNEIEAWRTARWLDETRKLGWLRLAKAGLALVRDWVLRTEFEVDRRRCQIDVDAFYGD